MLLYSFIIPLLCSLVLGFSIIPKILLVSYKKRLFDKPDGRKVHLAPVPRLGGFSFFPVLLVSLGVSVAFCYLRYSWEELECTEEILLQFLLFFVGLTLLYLLGVMDDLVGVNYRYKLGIQLVCAFLFPLGGLWLTDMDGLFGIYEIPWECGVPLTIFVVVYITNAINLIDGVDGLAAGLCGIALVLLGLFGFFGRLPLYSMLAFAMIGVLFPFGYYNVFGGASRCRKLFMGDTGSLILGYLLSFMIVSMSSRKGASLPEGMCLIAFSTLLIPMLDVIRVVMSRLRDGRGIFLPDKNHIHHRLIRTGLRLRWVMGILLLLSGLFSGITVWAVLKGMDLTFILITDLLLWGMMHLLINVFIFRRESHTLS